MKPVLLLLGSLVLLMLVFLSGVIITANVIAEPEPHKFANIDTPDLWTSKPKEIDPGKQGYERLPDAPRPVETAAEAPKPVAPSAPLGQPAQQAAATQAGPQALNASVDQTVTASVQPTAPGAPALGALQQPAVPGAQVPPVNTQAQPVAPQGVNVDAAHAQFCYARYRSYRIEDNSYQPFDGSPRRQCQAPGAPQVDTVATAPAAREPVARDVASAPVASAPRPRGEDRQIKLAPLSPEAMPSDEDWQAIESGNDDPRMIESAAPVGSSEGGSHEAWCANRYQSYRSDDNSYQPFDGSPRRTCQSPFG